VHDAADPSQILLSELRFATARTAVSSVTSIDLTLPILGAGDRSRQNVGYNRAGRGRSTVTCVSPIPHRAGHFHEAERHPPRRRDDGVAAMTANCVHTDGRRSMLVPPQ